VKNITYHHLASGMLVVYAASRLLIFELFYSKISALGDLSTLQVFLLGSSLVLLVCFACIIGITRVNFFLRILAYVFLVGVLLVFSSYGKHISYGMEQSLIVVCVLGLLHLLLERVKNNMSADCYSFLFLAWYCSIISLIVVLETHSGYSLLSSGSLLQHPDFQVNAALSAMALVMLSFGIAALLLTPTLVACVTGMFLTGMAILSQNIAYLPLLVIALFFLTEALTHDWEHVKLGKRAYVRYSLVGPCVVALVAFTYFLRSSFLSIHVIPPILSDLCTITDSLDVSAYTPQKKTQYVSSLGIRPGLLI
jgi:hypothetical protein